MTDSQRSTLTDEQLAERRAHIVDALERMDAGTYGLCARCGQEIPYGRLLVFPEARHCATCGAREG